MSEKRVDNTSYNLWRGGHEPKIGLLIYSFHWLGVFPIINLVIFKSWTAVTLLVLSFVLLFFMDKYRLTPNSLLDRVRKTIAGRRRYLTRSSVRRKRFANGT